MQNRQAHPQSNVICEREGAATGTPSDTSSSNARRERESMGGCSRPTLIERETRTRECGGWPSHIEHEMRLRGCAGGRPTLAAKHSSNARCERERVEMAAEPS